VVDRLNVLAVQSLHLRGISASFAWMALRTLKALWLGVLLACLTVLASTAQAQKTIDPALDEHVNRLASELRCLVCQNQTVADSQAPLAMQLKQIVREQLAQGASDQEVRDFMVERYGDFVLYRPPVSGITALLWMGPVLLFALGAGLLALHWRARRLGGAHNLDEEGDSLLDDDGLPSTSPKPESLRS
jgi:cytochrome c-type biogenesis protein CcmH